MIVYPLPSETQNDRYEKNPSASIKKKVYSGQNPFKHVQCWSQHAEAMTWAKLYPCLFAAVQTNDRSVDRSG